MAKKGDVAFYVLETKSGCGGHSILYPYKRVPIKKSLPRIRKFSSNVFRLNLFQDMSEAIVLEAPKVLCSLVLISKILFLAIVLFVFYVALGSGS